MMNALSTQLASLHFPSLHFYSNSAFLFFDFCIFQLALPMAILFFIFGLDDLFIDLIALVAKLRPERLSPEAYQHIAQLPEKRMAVLIASWKEGGILKKMIQGNLEVLQYKNFDFFLGVYPNDLDTIQEAHALSSQFSKVFVVLNSLNGPTSKGQMLNQIVKAIFSQEKERKVRYDSFLIHDSEDLIHPFAFKIMNWYLSSYDFVQIPVFSLMVSARSWVAGTYIDEFSEAHTKDLLVRSYLGVSIPSAGVGTALSRRLVQNYCKNQAGDLLNSETLTEDYELGVSTGSFGFESKFACTYFVTDAGRHEYIATREYFPKSFARSIRQKTRWTLGISFQGWEHLGWSGDLKQLYFLYRDRKGPFCNALAGIGLCFFLYCLMRMSQDGLFLSHLGRNSGLVSLFLVNLIFMINRMIIRMRSVYWIYGAKMALGVPVRFPLANCINAIAAFKATQQYLQIRFFSKQPVWIKTDHELPAEFGQSTLTDSKIEKIAS